MNRRAAHLANPTLQVNSELKQQVQERLGVDLSPAAAGVDARQAQTRTGRRPVRELLGAGGQGEREPEISPPQPALLPSERVDRAGRRERVASYDGNGRIIISIAGKGKERGETAVVGGRGRGQRAGARRAIAMATGARKVSIDARDQREGADRGSSSEALAPGAQGPSPCPWWPFQWANKRWGELVLSKRL